jgi:heme/copper-type cytochrome/quinol oxidase subunit 2
MTPGGWFVMLFSVGTVTGVFLWCLWKVLRTPDETEKLHGFSFETPDEKSDS